MTLVSGDITLGEMTFWRLDWLPMRKRRTLFCFREDGNVTQNKIDGTVFTVLSEVVVNINFKSFQQKRIGFYLLRNIKDRILSQP